MTDKKTTQGASARALPESAYDPPYLAAAIAAALVWLLYALTLAPTTAFWDTSEYIATAHMMGVPHPPGNPTFVVLARAWELLLAPFGLSVAIRINLFSATMGALAHGCWFLVAHRVIAYFTLDRVHRMVGASLAVLVSSTAFTVWSQSNVNEKVYTVSLFTIALLSWLAFLWRDNIGKGKDDNLILLMVFILALSVGNHLMAFLAAPALLVLILLVEPKTLMNWKLYLFAAAVAVLGLSIHLFLPLRAALDPVINEADPSTLTSLWESLARKQYDKPGVFSDPTDPSLPRTLGLIMAQLGNYFQYFDWQWGRTLNGTESLFGGIGSQGGGFPIRPVLTLIFVAVGAYGAYEHYLRDRTSWWYLTILFATVSIGLVGYLNFRYGYTFPQPGGGYNMDLHEVRERDYFFIVSFSMWGLWAGIGLFALWQRLAETVAETSAGSTTMAGAGRRYAIASPILLLAFLPLLLNWQRADRSDDYAARDWAYNLLMSTEPYAVLFTNGDNDTFPLWYLQEVEGIRRDVTVIVMSYLNTPWYVKQIRQLTTPCEPGQDPLEDPTRISCQRPFQPEMEAALYAPPAAAGGDRGSVTVEGVAPDTATGDTTGAGAPDRRIAPPGGWTSPERSILGMSESRIDSIPMLYASNPYNFLIEDPVEMRVGDLTFTLPGERILLPADVFLLNIVQNAVGDRPIYFATTTQAYDRIGLGENILRQGIALRLMEQPIETDPARGVFALPESIGIPGRYIDLPRTDTLVWDVFVHRGGIPDEWTFWPEPSTRNIPLYYLYAHYAAYAAHSLQGAEDMAERHLDRVEAWRDLAER